MAGHLTEAEERRGGCSGLEREQVQAQTGIETILDDIAVAAVVAVAEACSSGSQVAIVDGRIGWEAGEGVAGKAFDMRKPYWDCRVLEGYSTTSFVSSFA